MNSGKSLECDTSPKSLNFYCSIAKLFCICFQCPLFKEVIWMIHFLFFSKPTEYFESVDCRLFACVILLYLMLALVQCISRYTLERGGIFISNNKVLLVPNGANYSRMDQVCPLNKAVFHNFYLIHS